MKHHNTTKVLVNLFSTILTKVIPVLFIGGASMLLFVSVTNSYSESASNSKRISDVRSLTTGITTKHVEGISLMALVGKQSNLVKKQSIAGYNSSKIISKPTAGQNYSAGVPNFTVLGFNPDNFKDPVTGDYYKIGASTLAGGVFQIAARMESDPGSEAYVSGNYKPRKNQKFSAVGKKGDTTLVLPIEAMELFKKNDNISGKGIRTNSKIESVLDYYMHYKSEREFPPNVKTLEEQLKYISNNPEPSVPGTLSVRIILDKPLTRNEVTQFGLKNGAEQLGLIGDANGNPVTDGQGKYLPY